MSILILFRSKIQSGGRQKKREVSLLNFIDESKCFEYLRLLRLSEGVNCPDCDSIGISKNGFDHTQVDKQT